MLRWNVTLLVLVVLTGLMTFGVIPTLAIGLTRTLFFSYAGLLTLGLVIGLLQRS